LIIICAADIAPPHFITPHFADYYCCRFSHFAAICRQIALDERYAMKRWLLPCCCYAHGDMLAPYAERC